MKRVLAILVLVFVSAFSAEAQIKTEMMEIFSNEIDSVLISAEKSGTKKIGTEIQLYSETGRHKKRNLFFEPEIMNVIVRPDSLFEFHRKENIIHAKLGHSTIYETDSTGKRLLNTGCNISARDSCGFWITNLQSSQGDFASYQIQDSSDRIVSRIRIYSDSLIITVDTLTCYGDTMQLFVRYHVYRKDSIKTQIWLAAEDGKGSRDSIVWKSVSRVPVLEYKSYRKYFVSADRSTRTEIFRNTFYKPYSESEALIQTYYKYDSNGRLINAKKQIGEDEFAELIVRYE